jgi:hypothetical protein
MKLEERREEAAGQEMLWWGFWLVGWTTVNAPTTPRVAVVIPAIPILLCGIPFLANPRSACGPVRRVIYKCTVLMFNTGFVF